MPVAARGEANCDDGNRRRPSKSPPTNVRHVLSSSVPDDVTMSSGTANHRFT
jgi:hypothetical protein